MPSTNSNIDFSALCAPVPCTLPGWQTLALDGLLLSWMRLHFASGNIVFPSLQGRIWSQDPAQTQIQIERKTQWRPQETELRPAVILSRGAVQPLHLSIGDRLMMAGPAASTRSVYSVLQTGSHTLFAVSRSDGECEALAYEVFQEVLKFGPLVAQKLNLVRLRCTGLGVLSMVEEATQNFVVPVGLVYAYWDTWELVQAGVKTLAGTQQSVTSQ
jgi:hypothetical protein